MVSSSRIARKWLVLVTLVLMAWCGGGLADEPPIQPVLRLETGMHTAQIMSISADTRRQTLLTVSYDKTARLWSLTDGRLLRVLRPPINEGKEGQLFAGALSPDGRIAAVGGWTGIEWNHAGSVYLFDAGSGNLLQQLSGLPDVVSSLAFSPDGGLLVAGLVAANGLRVWNTSDWSAVWSDAGYDGSILGLAFTKSRGLIASSNDGYLRSYDAQGKLRRPKVKAPGGSRPFGVAISPDGERIAVGYDDSNRVDVLGWGDLRLLFSPDVTGINNLLGRVAWSADGSTLFAGSVAGDAAGHRIVRAWAQGGRGAHRDLPAIKNTILGLLPLSDRDVVFASIEWGVLRGTGAVELLHTAATADYRDAGSAFRLSPDGKQVQFGFEQFGKRPATFALSERRVIGGPGKDTTLTGANPSGARMTAEHWHYDTAPTLNGKALKLDPYERSLAVAVNGERLLLGADFYLRLFDKAGSQLWQQPAPSATWAVNITPNGRLAVAAFGDGTIRWYRMLDGVELLALFPHVDGRRWVTWTPQGYYDASAGADELIGWHVNRGADHEADFFPAGQFSEQFNRPDIVALDQMFA